jgi:hypothetical protein
MSSFQQITTKLGTFFQSGLGNAVAGAIAGSTATYLFGYTGVCKERDDAVNAGRQLLEDNRILNAENKVLLKKNNALKYTTGECNHQLSLIKSLHANTWFLKPDISHIGKTTMSTSEAKSSEQTGGMKNESK